MANNNLPGLSELITAGASDLVHVNNDGTDYKMTKRSFLAGDLNVTFGVAATLKSQVDNLASPGTYFGKIAAYGYQNITGLPVNSNCIVEVRKYSSTYVELDVHQIGRAHV